MQPAFFRFSIALFALLFSKGALATANFPSILKARYNISTDIELMCTLCHETPRGGPKSVKQPFGITLMNRGLVAYDINGLVRILTEMEAIEPDSDGDLVGDISELKRGTDPNVNDITGEAAELPRYGWYCSTPRGGAPLSATGGVWPTALLLCAWCIRRSSAQHARSLKAALSRNPRPER